MSSRVEASAAKIGVYINVKKIQYMYFNQSSYTELFVLSGSKLNVVEDFKFVGGLVSNFEADIKIKKAQAWTAYHKLKNI